MLRTVRGTVPTFRGAVPTFECNNCRRARFPKRAVLMLRTVRGTVPTFGGAVPTLLEYIIINLQKTIFLPITNNVFPDGIINDIFGNFLCGFISPDNMLIKILLP